MRRITLLAAACAALLVPAAAAPAAPLLIGHGDDPSVFVDDAGTAHIVWWDRAAGSPDQIHYCRLKRAAKTCDTVTTPVLTPMNPNPNGTINDNGSGPKIYGIGNTLVILDERVGDFWAVPGGSVLAPTLAYISTDGGNSFTGPAPVGDASGGIDGPGVAYGSDDDPRIATISQVTTGGTYVQAISPGAYAPDGANLGDDPSLSRAWYDGNVTLDNGVPVASFSDDTGNVMRRAASATADLNNIANWGPPVRLPGTAGRLAGGKSGLLLFDTEKTASDAYFVHKITGSTVGPGIQVTHTQNSDSGRFIQTANGRVIAVWLEGGILHLTTSTKGTTWPKTAQTLVPTDANEPDVDATDDGGGFAVAHRNGGTATPADIVAQGFGPVSPTGKPGIANVPGGGIGDPGDDNDASSSCGEIKFEAVDIKPDQGGGCFLPGKGAHAKEKISDGSFRLNGLLITPDKGVKTLINEKKHQIHSTGAVTVVADNDGVPPIKLWHGSIDVDLHGAGNAKAGKTLFDFPIAGHPANVEGFPILGDIPVVLTGGQGVSIPVSLKLPAGFAGAGNVDLTTKQGAGLQLPSLHIGPFDANFGVLGFEDIALDYANGIWTGTGTVRIPEPAGFALHADVRFQGTKFLGGHLSVQIPFPGVPVTAGTYLSGVDFGLTTTPFSISGGATFGAVPVGPEYAVSVHAGVDFTLGPPTIVVIHGEGAIFGTNVANAKLVYNSAVGFSATAEAHLGDEDIAGAFAKASFGVGKVGGKIRLGGSADVHVCAFTLCKTLGAVAFNDVGIALCFDTTPVPTGWSDDTIPKPTFGASVAHRWTDNLLSVDISPGCNVAAYGNPLPGARAHAALAGAQSFTLPAGATAYDVRVRGVTGPPAVTLTGPDGRAPNARAITDAATKATYFRITAPKAGAYTVTPGPASSPILDVMVAQGYGVPVPKATISSDGGRKRSLAFTIKSRDAKVATRFSEQVNNAGLVTIGETGEADGVLHFSAAPGPGGKRKIIAQSILPDGTIGTSNVVATYTAPGPARPGKPGAIHATRTRGGIAVRFGPARGAAGYFVSAKVRKGATVVQFTPAKTRKVFLPAISKRAKVTITVRALGADGRKGKPRTLRR